MRVKLPRACTGKEVVDAFKVATVINGNWTKWVPQDIAVEVQYEPGSVRQTVRKMGVRALRWSLGKKWGFFGVEEWKSSFFGPHFILAPLRLDARMNEVEIYIETRQYTGYHDVYRIDPGSTEFKNYQEQFEKILGRVYARLQPAGV